MQQIKQEARAGTLQSNDCLVEIRPGTGQYILESPVEYEFGEQIYEVVRRTLADHRIEAQNLDIRIEDRGALDCTIEARLKTAIGRAR